MHHGAIRFIYSPRLSIDMDDVRAAQQSEIHEVCMDHIQVTGFDRYTRDDVDDKLGKTWTNLATVYVSNKSSLSDLSKCICILRNMEYIVNVNHQAGGIQLEVKLTHETVKRNE